MLRQYLLFPDSPALLAGLGQRLKLFHAVLELDNGFIAHLRIRQRKTPTAAALAALAPTLLEAIQNQYPQSHASDLLQERHGVAAEFLNRPFVASQDWPVAEIMSAALVAAAVYRPLAALTELRQQLLSETARDLQARIDVFVRRLDAQVMAVLGDETVFPSRYNYLIGGTPLLRRNRLQAASTYPWVLRRLVCCGAIPAVL